ncbi:MAG: response regulator transcription factor [Bacteroidetes bacterium]|nr:response regulator transcription factor [Bacteroidota bacterium]MBS1630747.1 response regulator transcription factor [Bacteroidota bacterium]
MEQTAKHSARVLIVDDDPDILAFLQYNLNTRGYSTCTATDGFEALRLVRSFRPDLILMDVMMPGKDGITALKELRQTSGFESTAVILLTALSDEQHEISGLKNGADDYIAKPIKPELLATRIAATLRRSRKRTDADFMSFGALEIDRSDYCVRYQGLEISLARKEFELLALLASQPGKVFPRSEILQRIWGNEVIVGDRTIDVHIRKIRQKTGLELIKTVKGVGYKFERN